MIIGFIIAGILLIALFLYALILGASRYTPSVRAELDDEQMREIAKMAKSR